MANNTTPTVTTHWVVVTPDGDVIAWWPDTDTLYDGERSARAYADGDDRAVRASFDESTHTWVVA